MLAAAPAVEGLMLEPDALVDLESPLWDSAPFTAFLLGRSDIDDVALPAPLPPVTVLSATPITAHRGGVGAAQGRRRHARGVASRTESTFSTRLARRARRVRV